MIKKIKTGFASPFLLRRFYSIILTIFFIQLCAAQVHIIHPVKLQDVVIQDGFWLPKFQVWKTKTVYDVLDKLEGNYEPDRPDLIKEKATLGKTRNAFLNFDAVARGDKDTKIHAGPPWYDGLVYETIRGAADLLAYILMQNCSTK